MKTRGAASADQLRDWTLQAPGSWVLDCESEVLQGYVSDLFGYHLLQLGGLPLNDGYLQDCPVRCKARIDLQSVGLATGPFIQGAPECLPVASDSIDAVVLPHTLDFSPDPHQVLREVERILIPEGRLLIAGFNPWSLWGLWRWLPGRRSQVPWNGRFLSYPRIQDWLSLMGFAVEAVDLRAFRPPLHHPGLIRRTQFMERFGPRVMPMLAGVYVVRAVKQVSTVTPIRHVWRRLGRLELGTVKPTARERYDG